MVDQIIADRFQNALAKGRGLLSHHVVRTGSQKDRIEYEPFFAWQSQSLTLLETIFGPDHNFTRTFETDTTQKGFPQPFTGFVEKGTGVLIAAEEDFSKGWTWRFKEILHAEVFDDLLDMADHLVTDGGYTDAAAVLAGGALEGHLRTLSQKHDVPIAKVAAMNESLRKKSVYSQPTWRSVQAWYDLRTDAAHNPQGKYTDNEVKLMIAGIRDFIVRHPA